MRRRKLSKNRARSGTVPGWSAARAIPFSRSATAARGMSAPSTAWCRLRRHVRCRHASK